MKKFLDTAVQKGYTAGMKRDRTPVAAAEAADFIGVPVPSIYRIARHDATCLVRAKVIGDSVLFEKWSVEAEAVRLECEKLRLVAHAHGRKLRGPGLCSKCGSPRGSSRIIAHHDDYLKPKVVRWLCGPCHAAFHKFGHPRDKEVGRAMAERERHFRGRVRQLMLGEGNLEWTSGKTHSSM